MKRRVFITLLGGTTAGWPLVARAQQQTIPVVGFLAGPSPPYTRNVDAIHRGLAETGHTVGKNVAIEYRWAEGFYERLPALAADLVGRKVAAIATLGGVPPVAAAKAATSTIPIVFHMGGDPVGAGVVSSLNRPGGNVTGVSFLTTATAEKRLGLLRELVPTAKTFGLIVNRRNPNHEVVTRDLRAAAGMLGRDLVVVGAANGAEIEPAFATVMQRQATALLVEADPVFLTLREHIVALAARHAIPTIYSFREIAEAGGLMSYGASLTDSYRQVGAYAGAILKGAKPADLPVVQSATFELVINLKTAKTLGLEVPLALQAAADEVIE